MYQVAALQMSSLSNAQPSQTDRWVHHQHDVIIGGEDEVLKGASRLLEVYKSEDKVVLASSPWVLRELNMMCRNPFNQSIKSTNIFNIQH
jgi:hypothetical protein